MYNIKICVQLLVKKRDNFIFNYNVYFLNDFRRKYLENITCYEIKKKIKREKKIRERINNIYYIESLH